jgi:hypothetical protein
MDYLFVPGGSREEVLGSQIISRRPNTTLVTSPPAQRHVAGLFARLSTLAPTAANPNPRPIGDILLVAHGLEFGEYFVPLSRTLASPADFEKADDANTADVVRLTAPLLTPAGGGAMNTITVRLRGCNIGIARPFIEKLQAAMTPAAGTLNMTAPLHFDEFHHIAGGHVEYLAHKFTLKVQERFRKPNGSADRDALLAAFDAAALTYLDGTAIPAAAWDDWVPNNIHPPRARWKQSFDTDVDLSPAVGAQTTVTIHREYRYETKDFTWDWTAPDPGNQQDRLDVLRNSLPQGRIPNTPTGRHLYDPAYPWPLYERYGFTSIDDMVDNLHWHVTYTRGTLHFRATRYEYTVMLPITDPPAAPANPVLRFYNFFPSGRATVAGDLHLDETNGDLFLII